MPSPLTVVLLPGLDGTGLLFEPFVSQLPPGLTAQVVSYPVDQPLGYQALLDEVRSRLPSAGPFVLLGESFSGPLAIRIAAQPPSGLVALVLCATFVTKPVRWAPAFARAVLSPGLLRRTPIRLLRRTMFPRGTPRSLEASIERANRDVTPATLAERLREVLKVDVRGPFQQVRLPMLYLEAAQDRLVGPHNLAGMRRLRPDLAVARIQAPHWLLQSAPRQASQALVDFLTAQRLLEPNAAHG